MHLRLQGYGHQLFEALVSEWTLSVGVDYSMTGRSSQSVV